MPTERPRLRKREIAFALAAGALAAGGAALVLNDDVGPDRDSEQIEDSEVNYQLADFDQVSVEGPQDVQILYAEQFKVTATGSPEALGQIEAVVENGGLVIRPKEGRFSGNWGLLDDVEFTVAMPRVTRVTLAGSGDVTLDRVSGESFEGLVGGPGTLAIDQMEVERANFTVAGSGDLDASGNADTVAVNINGSGELHAGGLSAGEATVAIGGSGEADLTVLQAANVSITGSGEVDISGPGVCSVTRMGGGEVRCEGGGGDEGDEDRFRRRRGPGDR